MGWGGRISYGEKLAHSVLFTTFGVRDLTRQFRFACCPRLPYDCAFTHEGRPFLLEYDGLQHFQHGVRYVRTLAKFDGLQLRDRVKTLLAVQQGFKIVRIDHSVTGYCKMEEHLRAAFNSTECFYYSNPEWYEYLKREIPYEVWINYVTLPSQP